MTKENAKELQVDLAKDALALLVLHEELDVRSHRECIELIGEAWDIPAEEQRKPLALLEEEQAVLQTGEGHVLPEEELPMNASGTETLERIWGLFETSLRLRSEKKRTALYEMARWLEESQKPWDRIGITSEEQLTEKAAAS